MLSNTKYKQKMQPLTKVAAQYVCDLVANPDHIITTSGDYIVLYDLREHKVIKHIHLSNLNFAMGKGE